MRVVHTTSVQTSSDFNDVLGNGAGIGAVNKAEPIFELASCRGTSATLQGWATYLSGGTEREAKLRSGESPLAFKREPSQSLGKALQSCSGRCLMRSVVRGECATLIIPRDSAADLSSSSGVESFACYQLEQTCCW